MCTCAYTVGTSTTAMTKNKYINTCFVKSLTRLK